MSFWKKKSAPPAKRKEGPVPWDIHHGTFSQRDAFMTERRRRAAERDTERLNAQAQPTTVRIAREAGYATVAPGTLVAADEVVFAGNTIIDDVGHDAIVDGNLKSGFLATRLLPQTAITAESPYIRFALGDDLLAAVSNYLGVVPILAKIDVWYSVPAPREEARSSQLWHLDHDDMTQVKVFVNLNDVTPDMGPLTVVDAERSTPFPTRPGFNFAKGNRVADEDVRRIVGEDAFVSFTGPKGSAALVDTSRCLHFGSRVQPGATPRRMVMVQYLTPYSFEFSDDPYADAPYRSLVDEAHGALQRLVLGAPA